MRKKTVLIVLAILALGLIGTGLSALYQQNEYIREPYYDPKTPAPVIGPIKVSYGFPLGWHGYSLMYIGPRNFRSEYWFSLESLLLDAAFWIAISSIACIDIIKKHVT